LLIEGHQTEAVRILLKLYIFFHIVKDNIHRESKKMIRSGGTSNERISFHGPTPGRDAEFVLKMKVKYCLTKFNYFFHIILRGLHLYVFFETPPPLIKVHWHTEPVLLLKGALRGFDKMLLKAKPYLFQQDFHNNYSQNHQRNYKSYSGLVYILPILADGKRKRGHAPGCLMNTAS